MDTTLISAELAMPESSNALAEAMIDAVFMSVLP